VAITRPDRLLLESRVNALRRARRRTSRASVERSTSRIQCGPSMREFGEVVQRRSPSASTCSRSIALARFPETRDVFARCSAASLGPALNDVPMHAVKRPATMRPDRDTETVSAIPIASAPIEYECVHARPPPSSDHPTPQREIGWRNLQRPQRGAPPPVGPRNTRDRARGRWY